MGGGIGGDAVNRGAVLGGGGGGGRLYISCTNKGFPF